MSKLTPTPLNTQIWRSRNLSQIQRNVRRNGQHQKDTSDVDIDPFALRPYRILHSMKTAVNSKLEEMRKQGIIEKVNGSIPWLSLIMVISKKGGDIRLVLDMCVPNQALTQRGVQIPAVGEILQKMEGATIFNEVDLSQGYLQVTLAEESRYITALQTPNSLISVGKKLRARN